MCTAKQAQMLTLLQEWLIIAENRWENRRHQRDDKLRLEKVLARRRFRSFWNAIAPPDCRTYR